MKNKSSDWQLAEDMDAQLQIIIDAYEIGTVFAIDQALNHVCQVRRMKSNGVLDLVASRLDVGNETSD